MCDNNNYLLPLPNSRQMTGISLDQYLDNDLRGFAEGEFPNSIILNNDNDDPINSPTSATVTNNNTITKKTKAEKKKQRQLTLPRSLAILQFVDNSQQKVSKRLATDDTNNNNIKKKRRKHSLTRSLSILFRRLRPSLRRNSRRRKEHDLDNVFNFAGKTLQEQQQLSHKQHDKNNHYNHQNNNNDQLNIIPVAHPVSSNNGSNNYSSNSTLSTARSLPQNIDPEYSTNCSSGSRTAKTTTGNSIMTTATTFISDSSLIDTTGIDLDSSLFTKKEYSAETINAVLVKEDSRNNNINNNKIPVFQQGQQQMLKKRESRSSSIISRAASRSTITVNSIYNTFARDDDDALSSLFDMPSNNRSHGRLSACSSKFSLNGTVNTCMDGKQQKQQQQDMYNSQNNNNNSNNNSNYNTNADETGYDKRQPITSSDDPDRRRVSRPSSTIIHQYLIHFQDANCNNDNQNQQQIVPVKSYQDSTNNNESSISIPSNSDNKVEDEANQAAIEYIKLTAERLWNEDEGICERERIAEWLGTNDRFRSKVLKYYMSHFNFAGQRIDESFRTICNKLYLKAEAQQIDRILEVFASQYLECNPSTIMHNHDIIHAVVYSLLLLNTDLHCAHESHKKMTRAKFVKNTMETICDLAKHVSAMAVTTPATVTSDFDRAESNDIRTIQSSTSVAPNNQQVQKANRRNVFLPISDSVFSMLSSASTASSRWMLRRSISSKSFNSVPSTSRRSSSTTMTAATIKLHKRNSITSSNYKNSESENGEIYDNKITVRLISSRDSWLGDMETLLKELYTSVKMDQIIQNSQYIERIQYQQQQQQQQQPTTATSINDITIGLPTTKDHKEEMKNPYIVRRRRGQSLISPLAGLSSTFDDISLMKQKRRLSHSSTDPNIYGLEKEVYERAAINNDPDTKMCKEGIVMQKHVMEHASKKARYRGWQRCFLIVREGKIDLRRLLSTSKEQKRKSLWGSNNNQYKSLHIHDFYNQYEQNQLYNNYKKEQGELIQSIDLKHSVANTLPPPGWHGERHHVFSLQTSNGAVWLFESLDMESTLTWVTCCNYWAALLSKEALPGAICNLDYGWTAMTIQNDDVDHGYTDKMNIDVKKEDGSSADVPPSSLSSSSQQRQQNGDGNANNDNDDNDDDDNDDDDNDDDDNDDGDEEEEYVVISNWIPPAPSMITSQLPEADKILILEKHLISLQYEIKEHRIARESIYKRFVGYNSKKSDTKKSKALNNWEDKMQYLLHEVIKYRTYIEALKCSSSTVCE